MNKRRAIMDKWEAKDLSPSMYEGIKGSLIRKAIDKGAPDPTEHEIAKVVAETYFKAGEDKGKQEGIKEAIKVYDPYIKALEDENGSLIGLAYVHGWRSSQVKFGEKCRKNIKNLKARVSGKPSSKRG